MERGEVALRISAQQRQGRCGRSKAQGLIDQGLIEDLTPPDRLFVAVLQILVGD
jgi:hypothetical protein